MTHLHVCHDSFTEWLKSNERNNSAHSQFTILSDISKNMEDGKPLSFTEFKNRYQDLQRRELGRFFLSLDFPTLLAEAVPLNGLVDHFDGLRANNSHITQMIDKAKVRITSSILGGLAQSSPMGQGSPMGEHSERSLRMIAQVALGVNAGANDKLEVVF